MTHTDKAAEAVACNTTAPEEIWADEQIEHVGNRNNYHRSWSDEPQPLQHEEWAQKPTRYIRADLALPQDAESLRGDSVDKAEAWDAVAAKNARIAALKSERDRYLDCLMAVSGHLNLPHGEGGPCDDPARYILVMDGLDTLYHHTEAERVEHSTARFKAEAEIARLTVDLATARAETAMAFEVAARDIDCGCRDGVCAFEHACPKSDVDAIRALTPADATAALVARDKAKDDRIAELEAKLYALTEAADHLLQNYLRDELDEPDLCVDEGHWNAIHDLSSSLQSEASHDRT